MNGAQKNQNRAELRGASTKNVPHSSKLPNTNQRQSANWQSSDRSNWDPIIGTTVRQCRALQLKLNGTTEENCDNGNSLAIISGKSRNRHQEIDALNTQRPNYCSQGIGEDNRGNKNRNKIKLISGRAHSHENILLENENEEAESGDEISELVRRDPTSSSSSQLDLSGRECNENLQESKLKLPFTDNHRLLSKSTPNLLQQDHTHHHIHCHHRRVSHHNPTKSTHQHYYHDHHPHPTPTGQYRKSLRATRKMRDIRTSSNSLISLIRQTGDQLRDELNSLENLSAEPGSGTTSRRALTILGPSELVILNRHALKSSESNQQETDSDNQPRIYFEDSVRAEDENLIRQLRAIRSTVNERLQKMAIIIEQQKTTKI